MGVDEGYEIFLANPREAVHLSKTKISARSKRGEQLNEVATDQRDY